MAKKLKASAASNARPPSQAHSDPAADADHGRAALLAWKQLLVARGNRLLELAARERAMSDGNTGSEASPMCSRSGGAVKRNRARPHSQARGL